MITSCGPSQKTMDAKEDVLLNKWLNHSKSDLIRSWGQPDSITSDKKGGQILIYKEGVDFKSVMNEKFTGPLFSFRKEMFINTDSLIYNWKTWRRK
jgi:hypothetical protein